MSKRRMDMSAFNKRAGKSPPRTYGEQDSWRHPDQPEGCTCEPAVLAGGFSEPSHWNPDCPVHQPVQDSRGEEGGLREAALDAAAREVSQCRADAQALATAHKAKYLFLDPDDEARRIVSAYLVALDTHSEQRGEEVTLWRWRDGVPDPRWRVLTKFRDRQSDEEIEVVTAYLTTPQPARADSGLSEGPSRAAGGPVRARAEGSGGTHSVGVDAPLAESESVPPDPKAPPACPTCGSGDPRQHPANGSPTKAPTPCRDPFHGPSRGDEGG